MNQTIQHLSKICQEYRFKEKLLFVPSYSVGHQIGENLAMEKGSWINLRVTTVAGFAQELVGPVFDLKNDSCGKNMEHL